MSKNKIIPGLLALSLCLLTACQTTKVMTTSSDSQQPSKTETSTDTSASTTESEADLDLKKPAAPLGDAILEFKSEDGKPAFMLIRKDEKGSVTDSSGKLLLQIKEKQSGKEKFIKVEDASGKVVSYVRMPGLNSIKVEDGNHNLVYKLRFEKDLHYKLKDADDNVLYKIKEQPYGLKLEEGPDNTPIFKVKVKEGKVSLKAVEGDKTVLYAKSDIPPSVLACFAMNKLSKEQQYALAYALMFLRL